MVCSDHGSQTDTTYTCYSTSDSSIEGPTVSVPDPPSRGYHISAIVVPIVLIILLLVAVLVVVLAIVYLRYSRLKSEAPRMCPIESATARLLADSFGLATLGMEMIDDSTSLEFPRENLQFVKVLGKYKLCWEAR